ncbi:sensor histidine kinase [Halovalidus salilacus]|uniref:sensor histidine kinase n=1 Tax=Halovalidus salilacus TaxID=3075124 RepID=UPI003611618F
MRDEHPTTGDDQADPGRLRQAFENLFRNAVEHGSTSPRSRVHEDAVEHGDANETRSILVEGTDEGVAVEDDGPGIPPEKRAKVFESGYTEGGGTGLGLSIVSTVLEAHGWEVRVTEGSRGGARFEIEGATESTLTGADEPTT